MTYPVRWSPRRVPQDLRESQTKRQAHRLSAPATIVMSQNQIMINALDSEPGDMKVFGRQDLNRYWIVRLTDVNQGNNSNIFKMLPGDKYDLLKA